MNYYKAYPSLKLTPYIKQYWAIETSYIGNMPYLHRIIPTGLPELIFYLNYKPQTTKQRVFEDSGILNVQQNDYYDLIISDSLNIFSIYFRPEAVSQFFKIPLGELLNSGISLNHLNVDLARDLEGRLFEAQSFNERVGLVETFLIKILNNTSDNVDFRRMQYIINIITKTRGIVSIDHLVDKSCLSRKQFERKFIHQIGISPKQYLKIIRFQSLLHSHRLETFKNMTNLVYDHGYYDQSHFISDFKTFTGSSPGKILVENNMISDYFDP